MRARVSSEGAGPASMAAGKTETTNEAGGMAERGERQFSPAGEQHDSNSEGVIMEATMTLRIAPNLLALGSIHLKKLYCIIDTIRTHIKWKTS